MKRPKTLSAAFVKTVKRPGRYGDGLGGHGLSLLVKPTCVPGRPLKDLGPAAPDPREGCQRRARVLSGGDVEPCPHRGA